MTYDDMITRAIEEAKLRAIYNNAPNMIHEDNYEQQNCSLCGKEMKSIHETHNAFPLTKLQSAKEAYEQKINYRCCSDCNSKVMKARFDMMNTKPEDVKGYSVSDVVSERVTPLGSIFETPQAQKRFAELGQDFYATDLGKDFIKRGKNA